MMMETVLGLEPWLGYLIIAVILTYTMAAGGWVLAKAGRSPLWVLLLLVPYVNVIAIWVFAYARWPFLNGAPGGRDEPPAPGD